jgi:hypothetical protein
MGHDTTHTSGVAGQGARLDFSTLSPRAASISGRSGQALEDAVLDFVDPDDSTVKSHWAILVAGSNGWGNYRHQADVCHAYQVLKAGGLKDERIIVLMYDDIANNEENPHQGTIVNSPGVPTTQHLPCCCHPRLANSYHCPQAIRDDNTTSARAAQSLGRGCPC